MRTACCVGMMVAFVGGCATSSPGCPPPGTSFACTCPNGRSGGQTCNASGALMACVCETPSDASFAADAAFPDAAFQDAGTDAPAPGRDAAIRIDAAPPRDAGGGHPRPLGSPDVLIVAVSGHCNPRRCLTSYNDEQLLREGTVEAIEAPLRRVATVEHMAFTDNLYNEPAGSTVPDVRGFLALVNELDRVRTEWIVGFDEPTRVIVIAHSHGTVWAHLALHVLEGWDRPVPVDVLIDLDGTSHGWQEKGFLWVGDAWGAALADYTAREGVMWPFDVSRVVDAFTVPGVSARQDIEDLVPNYALFNLEVASRSPPEFEHVRDEDLNYRLDGSADGLLFFLSTQDHNGVTAPTSDSIGWVNERIAEIYAF